MHHPLDAPQAIALPLQSQHVLSCILFPFFNLPSWKNAKVQKSVIEGTVWIFRNLSAAQELSREGVLISPRMMADHMPDYLTAVQEWLAENAGQGTHQGENRNGDYTIDIPSSPANCLSKGKGKDKSNRMEKILSKSLVRGRAWFESEEDV